MPAHRDLLRLALLADAAASGAVGLLLTAAAGPLDPLLGLPGPLLRGVGLVLLLWTVGVGWLATRAEPPRAAVLAVVVVNLLWVADSVLLLAFGPVDPTALGTAFVLAQALAVLGFAAAQWLGLRQSAPAPALA